MVVAHLGHYGLLCRALFRYLTELGGFQRTTQLFDILISRRITWPLINIGEIPIQEKIS